jgi:hypothetical protein
VDGAKLEKGSGRVTRRRWKGAVHRARQDGRGKREEKVRGRSRERGRGYIDATDVLGRQGNAQKRREGRAIPEAVSAIPQGAVRCPSAVGGGGRHIGGAMRAVSSAPLTVTSKT